MGRRIGPRTLSGMADRRIIQVCRTCSNRLGGGFGAKRKTPLAKALRRHLGIKWWRGGPLAVAESRCLGICPRGAVTVRTESGGRILVPAGADLSELTAEIGI